MFVRQSTQNKNYWIKQIKQKRATNFTGAEWIALHKPGVCEAITQNINYYQQSVQQTTGAEGKALQLYGGAREEHCTNCR